MNPVGKKRKKSQKEIIESRRVKSHKLDKLCESKLKFKEPIVPSLEVLKQYIETKDIEWVLTDPVWLKHFIQDYTQQYGQCFAEFVLDGGFLHNPDTFNILMESFQDKLGNNYGQNRSKSWHWLSILLVKGLDWSCLLQITHILHNFSMSYKSQIQTFTLNNITLLPIWDALKKQCFERFRQEKFKEYSQLQFREEYAMKTAKFHLEHKLPISMGFYISKISSGNTITIKVHDTKMTYKLDKPEMKNWFRFTHPSWTSNDIIPVMTIDTKVKPIVEMLMKKTNGIFYDFFKDIILFANLCNLQTEPSCSRMKPGTHFVDWSFKIPNYLFKCNMNQDSFDLKTWEKLRDNCMY